MFGGILAEPHGSVSRASILKPCGHALAFRMSLQALLAGFQYSTHVGTRPRFAEAGTGPTGQTRLHI